MSNIKESLKLLIRGLKIFVKPSYIIDEIDRFFRDSTVEKIVKYERTPEKIPVLKDRYLLIVDLWGRNMLVDYIDKKAMPVDEDFIESIIEMRHEYIPDEYKRKIELLDTIKRREIMYEKILDVDKKIFNKVIGKDEKESIAMLIDIARDIYSHRFIFSNIYGQAPMAPVSNAIRALYITEYIEPSSEILFIGDNDALSILLARIGYKVTVVDVDEYVCRFLKLLAKKFSVDVETYLVDVRVPFEIEKTFDAFVTDPEHTPACLYVFVARGLQFIKKNGLCFVSWESGSMQRRIIKALIKKLGLIKLEHRKDCIYYITPIKDFYEHIKKLRKKDIEFSIPRWHGDLWVLKKTKTPDTSKKEFTVSLY